MEIENYKFFKHADYDGGFYGPHKTMYVMARYKHQKIWRSFNLNTGLFGKYIKDEHTCEIYDSAVENKTWIDVTVVPSNGEWKIVK